MLVINMGLKMMPAASSHMCLFEIGAEKKSDPHLSVAENDCDYCACVDGGALQCTVAEPGISRNRKQPGIKNKPEDSLKLNGAADDYTHSDCE